MWRQVAVSAFLRYETYDPELVATAPAVVRLQSLRTVEEEDALLEGVLWLYQSGVVPQVRHGQSRSTFSFALRPDPSIQTACDCCAWCVRSQQALAKSATRPDPHRRAYASDAMV